MSGEIAGTGRRFRREFEDGTVAEAVFPPEVTEVMSHYTAFPSHPRLVGDEFLRVELSRLSSPYSAGWIEVPGVPSPSTEEESHPALTAAAPPAEFHFDVKADAARDYDQELTGELPVDVNAEPDAEESIDEYVARIDEGVVPAAAANAADNRRTDARDAEIAELNREVDRQKNLIDRIIGDIDVSATYLSYALGLSGSLTRRGVPTATGRACKELLLYREFYAAALAAHAESSPNKVEVEFGRACDRLRRGLRELDGATREERVASSQTLKMEAVPT